MSDVGPYMRWTIYVRTQYHYLMHNTNAHRRIWCEFTFFVSSQNRYSADDAITRLRVHWKATFLLNVQRRGRGASSYIESSKSVHRLGHICISEAIMEQESEEFAIVSNFAEN